MVNFMRVSFCYMASARCPLPGGIMTNRGRNCALTEWHRHYAQNLRLCFALGAFW